MEMQTYDHCTFLVDKVCTCFCYFHKTVSDMFFSYHYANYLLH